MIRTKTNFNSAKDSKRVSKTIFFPEWMDKAINERKSKTKRSYTREVEDLLEGAILKDHPELANTTNGGRS